MPVYVDLLMLINFFVDFCLLVGTDRLSGHTFNWKRTLFAAVLGGIYGGICVIPECEFLAHTFWRIAVLSGMAIISFGCRRDALRRCVLFVLLSMALGGVAMGLTGGGFWTLILSALGVCMMCLLGFRGRTDAEYLDVELEGLCLTALRDTGNTLTDPITGQQVLVVSAKVGAKLLGLTPWELTDPASILDRVSGGRLIPYRAVGKSSFLLAKKYKNVRIGQWKGDCLVAFAPNEIGQGRPYEALTGGAL